MMGFISLLCTYLELLDASKRSYSYGLFTMDDTHKRGWKVNAGLCSWPQSDVLLLKFVIQLGDKVDRDPNDDLAADEPARQVLAQESQGVIPVEDPPMPKSVKIFSEQIRGESSRRRML